MSNICKLLNINKIWIRITECFDKDCLCVILNSIFKIWKVVSVNKCCVYTKLWKCVLKVVICAAVDCLSGYNVVACLSKSLKCISKCRCTGSCCKSSYTALKSRNSLFKNVLSWICKSAVNVTRICKTESCLCVVAAFEYIRSYNLT